MNFAYQISIRLWQVNPRVLLDTSLGSQTVWFLLRIQITRNSVKEIRWTNINIACMIKAPRNKLFRYKGCLMPLRQPWDIWKWLIETSLSARWAFQGHILVPGTCAHRETGRSSALGALAESRSSAECQSPFHQGPRVRRFPCWPFCGAVQGCDSAEPPLYWWVLASAVPRKRQPPSFLFWHSPS